uniref:Uncharacterized protein n=1 Tax=Lepeophtheirus salmonis TaxID=72036 RepID=A0A0K2SZF9_LEPSM
MKYSVYSIMSKPLPKYHLKIM